MSFTLVLAVICAVPLLLGVYCLVRGKRRLGVALLVVAAIPIGLIATVIGMMTGVVSSVLPPAAETLDSLFKTPVPTQVRITHYTSQTLGMDPSFWWEVSPADESFLQALIKNAALERVANPALGQGGFPAWWNTKETDALPEFYRNDKGLEGSGGVRYVWVDRGRNRLLLYFMGT